MLYETDHCLWPLTARRDTANTRTRPKPAVHTELYGKLIFNSVTGVCANVMEQSTV